MESIDLRSDTVTAPTPEMREAMATASVGDDVFEEDPTVNELERRAAERLGHEAGLFVTSGTQGNLTAILSHCQRASEIIVGRVSHIFGDEVGGAAALGGVHTATVPVQEDGTLLLDDIRGAIRDSHDVHNPLTAMVGIENTNNNAGGVPLTTEYVQSVRALCDEHSLIMHIDGARIWNAAAALDVDIRELTASADSVTFCLSKGLCAPVGSILCGSEAFIGRARRIRKMLGSGMRQVGILAAAGLISLDLMTTRLHVDHANAERLASLLEDVPGINVHPAIPMRTNMVFFTLADDIPVSADEFRATLARDYDVKISPRGGREFRAVTHYWITPEDVETAACAMQDVLAKAGQAA